MINSLKPKDVDEFALYFGDPYAITADITIYQPTIGDILACGEQEFYSTVNIFVGNSTMYRLQLWEIGQDWNKISNYELFVALLSSINPKITEILFHGIDFSKFKIMPMTYEDGTTSIVLYNITSGVIIDEQIYTDISHCLRHMFGIFPKDEWAKGKLAKEIMIEEEKTKYEARRDQPYQSFLLPLVSSCLNHPGFKYKKQELKSVGIFEFMDSVQRLQTYESSTALLKGIYSGFVDTSSINNEDLNFMRSLK